MRYKAIFAAILNLILLSMLTFVFFVSRVDQSTEFLVGASYMTFWGTGIDIDWSSGAIYWPLLGNYSSSNAIAADQHIRWALEDGIDFFFLDYGWATEPDSKLIEDSAVNGLLKAKRIKDFRFCVFYFPYAKVNDANVDVAGLMDDFSHINETYVSYPSYLRLENRPVVILADFPRYLHKNLSYKEINNLFYNLRQNYGLYLVPAFWPNQPDDAINALNDARRVYDAITLWGSTTIIESNEAISYSEYLNKTKHDFEEWSVIAQSYKADFVPLICPGYNNMIYAYMNKTEGGWWAIVARDADGFREVCELAKSYSSPPRNMILLFTWNDFKEGTSIEPTTDYGSTYLDIISSTLGASMPFIETLLGRMLLYGIPIAVAVIIVAAFLMKRKRHSVLLGTEIKT